MLSCMIAEVDVQKLRRMLVAVCQMLLQSTRELPSVKEVKKAREEQEGGDKSFSNTDYRIKVLYAYLNKTLTVQSLSGRVAVHTEHSVLF